MNPDPIESLRQAARLSPDNVPLRQHLAQTLLQAGRGVEAEAEFRQVLALAPENLSVKLGLAQAYYQQGKGSHALVLAEDVVKAKDAPAGAFVLLARLLFAAGDQAKAASLYRRALEIDAKAEDAELSERLGVTPAAADSSRWQENEGDEGRERVAWEEPAGQAVPEFERPRINFADVGGLDGLKEEIRMKIIYPLQHADMFKAYGKAIGGGILLYGPPGCGKTYLARATAGEIKARFLAIGISDVLDMWIGSSEKNLHELFEQARRNKPCVLFFDEVDALGANRTDLRHSGARHLVNQFLAELDGVQASNDGLLILAATNAPWYLDSAFRRPGRFDRILFVPPPDAPARAAILRVLCQGKPLDRVDFDYLGKQMEHFSGADLKAVLDQSIEAKLREAMKDGVPRPLTTKDLQQAAKGIRPSTREWFATARNYALYANQGGLYDDILKYFK